MSEATSHKWTASDGTELSYRQMGEGHPVILLHGLFSSAYVNWIKFGTAAKVAARGFRVIMPDHRAHGDSAAPGDIVAYPRGILARDLNELIAHLGLTSFDLGGFSLGSRTIVQAVGEGLKPRRAVLSGMGLQGLDQWERRQQFYIDAIDKYDVATRGDPHWMSIQFMKTMKVDRDATRHVLGSFAAVDRVWLSQFTMPTLVLIGTEDNDNGSARDLAHLLPDPTYAEVPGNHMNCITKPEFGERLAEFIGRP
nr:alpha/beta fold hydrolase [uncultured Sphingomonas sp.]